jgi:hypothetical protein
MPDPPCMLCQRPAPNDEPAWETVVSESGVYLGLVRPSCLRERMALCEPTLGRRLVDREDAEN